MAAAGRAASGGIEPPLGGGRPAAARPGAAGGFGLGPKRRARRPSLTPMIDVVFLLLVFFMLAARFGVEARLPLSVAAPGGGTAWSGPPRLVDVGPEGLWLNGAAVEVPGLVSGLGGLVAGPDDPVVVRPRDGASLQRLVDVIAVLEGAGHARLLVVE